MKLILLIALISFSQICLSSNISTYSHPGSKSDNTYLGKLVKYGCMTNPITFNSGFFTEDEIDFLNKFNPYQRLESHQVSSSDYQENTEGDTSHQIVQQIRLGTCKAKIQSSEQSLSETQPLRFKSASYVPDCHSSISDVDPCGNWFQNIKSDFEKNLKLTDDSKRPISVSLQASTEPIRDLTFVQMRNKHCKRKNGIFRKLKLCQEIKRNEACFESFLYSRASKSCSEIISKLKQKYLDRLSHKRVLALEKEFLERLEKENKSHAQSGSPPKYTFLKTNEEVLKRKEGAKKIIEYSASNRGLVGPLRDLMPAAPSDTEQFIKKLDQCITDQKLNQKEVQSRFIALRSSTGGIPSLEEKLSLDACTDHFPRLGKNDPECFKIYKAFNLATKLSTDSSCFPNSMIYEFSASDPLIRYIYGHNIIKETQQLPIMQGEAFIFGANKSRSNSLDSKSRTATMSLKRLPLEDITLQSKNNLFIDQRISKDDDINCYFKKDKSVSNKKISAPEKKTLEGIKRKLSLPETNQLLKKYHIEKNDPENIGEYSILKNNSNEMKKRCKKFTQREKREYGPESTERRAIESQIVMDFLESQFSEVNQSSCDFKANGESINLGVEKGTFGNLQLSISLPNFKGRKFKSIFCDNEKSLPSPENQDKIKNFDLYNPQSWRSSILRMPKDQELNCKCESEMNKTKNCSFKEVLQSVAVFYQTSFGKKVVEASQIAESGIKDESFFEDQVIEGSIGNIGKIVDQINGCEKRRADFKKRYESLNEAARKFLNPGLTVPLLDIDDSASESQ
jgi:hypothetical protein